MGSRYILTEKRYNVFIILYSIYLIDSVLSESRYVELSKVSYALTFFRYFSLVGMACLALIKQMKIDSKKLIICVIGFAAAAITAFFFQGGISVLFILFIALASKNVSIEKIYKTTVECIILSYCFVILSSKIGIIPDVIGVRYVGANAFLGGEYIRHAMGFMVSNQVPTTFLTMYLVIIAWKKEKIPFWFNCLVAVGNYVIFKTFGSRLVFIVTYICLLTYYTLFVLIRLKKYKCFLFDRILPYCFIVCALASLILSYIFNPSSAALLFLNSLSNNRISMSQDALLYYGISLIGNGKLAGTYYGELSTITVDNGYISLLIQQGLVVSILFLILWTWISKKALTNNRFVFCSIFFISIMNLINSDMISYRVALWYCLMVNANDSFSYKETVIKNYNKKSYIAYEELRKRI